MTCDETPIINSLQLLSRMSQLKEEKQRMYKLEQVGNNVIARSCNRNLLLIKLVVVWRITLRQTLRQTERITYRRNSELDCRK